MWTEPYLETCCRSALHRLTLCGVPGRPAGLKDGPCLERLTGMGFAQQRPDQRYEVTPAGLDRHSVEIVPTRQRGTRPRGRKTAALVSNDTP